MSKPSLPQGTRDFSAETVHKRNYILSTIKQVFELFGFQPLETPAMENLDTLMGKYGEEGDRLIFKILNNGLNDPKNIDKAKAGFEKVLDGKNSPLLTERALKYDLTIPFARYVAMNHGILTFPFKRYQIQPVWRADRPQKGRYREFTQCDADIVGSNALMNELDLTNIYHDVFIALGIKAYTLKINNRKILLALAQSCGGEHLLTDITIAIDKLDKIGLDKVKAELEQRGLNETQIKSIEIYLGIKGNNEEKLKAIIDLLGSNEMAKKGFEELQWITQHSTQAHIEIDFTLARGLNYYTGSIFEVKAPDTVQMGSIGGGGRYDNLTELFGVPGIPGVGISFGVDRIFDVMEELNLFPADAQFGTKVMFFNLGESESLHAYALMQDIRKNGISAELYHESVKMDKQFKYADKKKISYAVILGSKEMAEKVCMVKHLKTGLQESVSIDALADYLKNKISAE
jgi:histidyl-tRNA synthetase